MAFCTARARRSCSCALWAATELCSCCRSLRSSCTFWPTKVPVGAPGVTPTGWKLLVPKLGPAPSAAWAVCTSVPEPALPPPSDGNSASSVNEQPPSRNAAAPTAAENRFKPMRRLKPACSREKRSRSPMRISLPSGMSRAAAVFAGCPLSREKYYSSPRVATSSFSPARRGESSICGRLPRPPVRRCDACLGRSLCVVSAASILGRAPRPPGPFSAPVAQLDRASDYGSEG